MRNTIHHRRGYACAIATADDLQRHMVSAKRSRRIEQTDTQHSRQVADQPWSSTIRRGEHRLPQPTRNRFHIGYVLSGEIASQVNDGHKRVFARGKLSTKLGLPPSRPPQCEQAQT